MALTRLGPERVGLFGHAACLVAIGLQMQTRVLTQELLLYNTSETSNMFQQRARATHVQNGHI